MLGCSHDVSFGEREGVCTGGVGCGEVRGAEERGAVTGVADMGDTRALLFSECSPSQIRLVWYTVEALSKVG